MTEPLNPDREPAPAPLWPDPRLVEAMKRHRIDVENVLDLMPWETFPMEEPGLGNFRRDVYFFVVGGLMARGVPHDTAAELSADIVVGTLDQIVRLNKTQGNA
jgi:hypothetical protein